MFPLAQVRGRVNHRVVLVESNPGRVEQLKRGESYVKDVESAELGRLIESGAIEPTSDYDALATETEAILMALQTPSACREPDLSIAPGAVGDIASRLQKGQPVVLESTTYSRTTRTALARARERRHARRRGLLPRFLAGAGRSGPKIDNAEHAEDRRRRSRLRTERRSSLQPRSGDLSTRFPEAAELTKLLENIFRSVMLAANELSPSSVTRWESTSGRSFARRGHEALSIHE